VRTQYPVTAEIRRKDQKSRKQLSLARAPFMRTAAAAVAAYLRTSSRPADADREISCRLLRQERVPTCMYILGPRSDSTTTSIFTLVCFVGSRRPVYLSRWQRRLYRPPLRTDKHLVCSLVVATVVNSPLVTSHSCFTHYTCQISQARAFRNTRDRIWDGSMARRSRPVSSLELTADQFRFVLQEFFRGFLVFGFVWIQCRDFLLTTRNSTLLHTTGFIITRE